MSATFLDAMELRTEDTFPDGSASASGCGMGCGLRAEHSDEDSRYQHFVCVAVLTPSNRSHSHMSDVPINFFYHVGRTCNYVDSA